MVIDECHSFKPGNIILEGRYWIAECLGAGRIQAEVYQAVRKDGRYTIGVLLISFGKSAFTSRRQRWG